MTRRMLIDATHAEETRVVVTDGNRLDDYDVESSSKKQLKGNIYLAKVIRIEPSLQAAFVEYGGNRHGFLAFSEIHPDYFQIPVADREKLLALQEEELAAASADNDGEDIVAESEEDVQDTDSAETASAEAEMPAPDYVGGETDTGDEALIQKKMARFLRSYKIQEVIRRRQVLLIQVVKEERGNKGAALTTYVSLAGRYCVLMPNALRGGGVSRKITSASDRRRLKDIIAELQLPRGMAMIVRTAGAQRPRPEVMRDCEYLLHLWDDIRELTMKSMAPALIYEEASLIKRAIRDVYTRDIEEIVVDGETAWKAARDFMRMLMPQNVQKVHMWRKEHQPLFAHYQVEGQLDAMLSPTVQLRSGGYLVINQTEALVSIDVNSGRSTRERNIEETAVKTNLEAADEVARQLRLRDLAGLIVIDFIDMESRRHNGQVERRLKEALRHDRARIQVGGISHFGLLEMSRQRLRPSVAESAFITCPHCQGTGIIRGIESSALHVLRAVEEEGARRRSAEIIVHVAGEIALYILNHKRSWLAELESRHDMTVQFAADSSLPIPTIRVERVRAQTQARQNAPEQEIRDIPIRHTSPADDMPAGDPAEESEETAAPLSAEEENGGEETGRRRRRRRRRRNGQRGQEDQQNETGSDLLPEEGEADAPEPIVAETTRTGTQENLMPGRSRTRMARKGRTVQPAEAPRQDWRGPTPADPFGGGYTDIFDLMDDTDQEQEAVEYIAPAPEEDEPEENAAAEATHAEAKEVPAAEEKPRGRRGSRYLRGGRRGRKPAAESDVTGDVDVIVAEEAAPAPAVAEKPAERPSVVVQPVVIDDAEPSEKPRRGWWNRK
ncbi:ribonuclease E/G [Acetobacter sp. AN02]|uniref:Rne/Rng family ribonuclease n=1 Tax=Acetobacter sp. AN02 TaxID=2894186 RepID=UPI00325FC3B3